MFVKGLHNGAAILITVVHLNPSVLITDELLHIDATLSCHAKHDAALFCEARIIDVWFLYREILALFGLICAHFILSREGRHEFIQIGV